MEIESEKLLGPLESTMCTRIVSFLTLNEVFTKVNVLNHFWHNLVSYNANIVRNCFYTICNPTHQLDLYLGQATGAKLLKDLQKLIRKTEEKYEELPYHGFKTDGGCDQNSPLYFFDHCFKLSAGKKLQAVCTRDGKNFHIEGALAVDYFDEKSLSSLLSDNFAKEQELLLNYTEHLQNGKQAPEKILLNVEREIYQIESSFLLLKEFVPIISEIHISRAGHYTCPVKTLMVFVSDERVEFKGDAMLNLFSIANSKDKLKEILMTHRDQLPPVEYTNIQTLKEMSRIYHQEKIVGDFDACIFKNRGPQVLSKLRPICWVRFNKLTRKICNLVMPKTNRFSGHFIVIKLLDCDDLRAEYDDDYPHTNIDMSFTSIRGTLLHNLKTVV